MALVAVTPFEWPQRWDVTAYGNLLIDAANEKAAMIVQAPKAGTIDGQVAVENLPIVFSLGYYFILTGLVVFSYRPDNV